MSNSYFVILLYDVKKLKNNKTKYVMLCCMYVISWRENIAGSALENWKDKNFLTS